MKRYVHIEDNEDGTTTMTTNVGGVEQTVVLPVAIDGFGNLFPEAVEPEILERFVENAIVVPNQVPEP